MKTVDVTFQNLDSSEISLTDVRLALSLTLTNTLTLNPTPQPLLASPWVLCILASSAPASTRADKSTTCPRCVTIIRSPTSSGSGASTQSRFARAHMRQATVCQPVLRCAYARLQVSHYFDSDPTKLVAGLREDGRAPASFIADTTTANAQVAMLCWQRPTHAHAWIRSLTLMMRC